PRILGVVRRAGQRARTGQPTRVRQGGTPVRIGPHVANPEILGTPPADLMARSWRVTSWERLAPEEGGRLRLLETEEISLRMQILPLSRRALAFNSRAVCRRCMIPGPILGEPNSGRKPSPTRTQTSPGRSKRSKL